MLKKRKGPKSLLFQLSTIKKTIYSAVLCKVVVGWVKLQNMEGYDIETV